jgi:hypothetical protein
MEGAGHVASTMHATHQADSPVDTRLAKGKGVRSDRSSGSIRSQLRFRIPMPFSIPLFVF